MTPKHKTRRKFSKARELYGTVFYNPSSHAQLRSQFSQRLVTSLAQVQFDFLPNRQGEWKKKFRKGLPLREKKIAEQTRSNMRNPFVDTEGLAVMSQQPTPIKIESDRHTSSEKKRGFTHIFFVSLDQKRLRWQRVRIDSENWLCECARVGNKTIFECIKHWLVIRHAVND